MHQPIPQQGKWLRHVVVESGKGKNCFAQGAPAIEVTGGQAKHLRRSC